MKPIEPWGAAGDSPSVVTPCEHVRLPSRKNEGRALTESSIERRTARWPYILIVLAILAVIAHSMITM